MAGNVVGLLVIVFGIVRFFLTGAIIPLLLSLAVVVVGPGEDFLEEWVKRRAPTPEEGAARAKVVDLSTSIAFLVLLGVVMYLAS